MFAGVASADEAKCVNTVNKWAARVAEAQASEHARCIKGGDRGAPIPMELCITSDARGKVGKAASKLKEKLGKDCQGMIPTVPSIDTSDPNALSRIMIDKELVLIHEIFGTDLDEVIVGAPADKDGWRCQSAVAKAAQKCQDAKLATYNRCKKDQLRAGLGSAQALQDACLGANGTGESIPDTKARIGKKCGNGLGAKVGKKCGMTENQALFPSWDPNSDTLAEFIDQKIGCEVCKALNALDGLSRYCEEFDDGIVNASCGSCGNDVVDEAEECDGSDDAACPGQCQTNCSCPVELFCGDGIVNQLTEHCDGSDDAACPGECQPDCRCPPGGPCPADGTDTGCWAYDGDPLCHFCCVSDSDACAACSGAYAAQCRDAYYNALCDEELNRAGCGGVCCP
jgi:hypothetical protein